MGHWSPSVLESLHERHQLSSRNHLHHLLFHQNERRRQSYSRHVKRGQFLQTKVIGRLVHHPHDHDSYGSVQALNLHANLGHLFQNGCFDPADYY
jgi:hypothetical protein